MVTDNIELSNDQIFAIYELENWWHNVDSEQYIDVSGPSGSGKSVLIKYFIERIGLSYDEVLFVAYMGKAASRLAMEGLPAKTIHSAIYEYKERYIKDENNHYILDQKGRPKKEFYFELKEKIGKHIKLIVLDEAGEVETKMALDLLSFGIPLVALGDLNQLPPVFGNPFFLKNPKIQLHQIMRQAEGNPIIYLSQEILAGRELKYGVYSNQGFVSSVIHRSDLDNRKLKEADMVICCTNKLRNEVNQYYRERILEFKNLDVPHYNEKIICRKNNWHRSIKTKNCEIYLTNGTTGFIDGYDRSSYNGKTISIDFRPDFANGRVFRNLKIDYNRLFNPMMDENDLVTSYFYDRFNFAYAITIYGAQGSDWQNVMYLDERFTNDKELKKKIEYTAITRARKMLTFVK